MKGTVQKVNTTKTGKSYLCEIGGQTYFAKLDSGIDKAVGQGIDFTAEASHFQGKTTNWVTGWHFDQGGILPSPPLPQSHVAPPKQTSGQFNGDRWWANFMSNCVGQAIAAKTITSEGQIMAWALAAYTAARRVERVDDDIPI